MANLNKVTPTKLTLSYFHNASTWPFQYKTVAQSFDELASQYPDHECYIFKGMLPQMNTGIHLCFHTVAENKRYTYATFKDEIDSLATSFHELGLQNGDRIAVSLPNSSENIVLSYAASRLGLIKVRISLQSHRSLSSIFSLKVHMNPSMVACELVTGLNKVGCSCIVVNSTDTALSTLKNAVPDLDDVIRKSVPTLKYIVLTGSNQNAFGSVQGVYSYNELITKGSQQHSFPYEPRIDPDCALSVFLTSGSTGQPKAIVHSNFSICNAIALLWSHYGTLLLRYCAPLSMHHVSTGIYGILLPSSNRCTVVIPALMVDAKATMNAIDEEKCTCMISGPVLLRNILALHDRHKSALNSLQYVIVGGTPLQPQFLRQLEEELGIARVRQGYGMTESGSIVTCGLKAASDDIRRHTSIGQCMPHIELKIVDDNGMILSIGSPGDIWIRSRLLMSGYYGDEHKTKEAITESQWFPTGDLATMDEDGYLYFAGRKNEIIIRAGINIFPREIEEAIEEYPSVTEAHVFSIPDAHIDEVVCAFVILKSGRPCDVDELKIFLSDKLTAYKVPEHIRFVDDLTRISVGKVPKSTLTQKMIELLNEAS
jgi:fatty-acyl-CoA synthase